MSDGRFSRQILAFGEEGQRKLATAKIGIVGLGGMGSHIAQALAYLGAEDFLTVDDDIVDIYWSDGSRYDVQVTQAATDTFQTQGGSGSALPANGTAIVVSEQTVFTFLVNTEDPVLDFFALSAKILSVKL